MDDNKLTIGRAAGIGARFVLVPANPFKAISRGIDEVQSVGRKALRTGARVLGPERVPEGTEFLAAIGDPRARFDAAMAFYGRDADDLPAIEKGMSRMFWTWAVATVLMLAWAIVTTAGILRDGGAGFMLLTSLGVWGIAALCVAKSAAASFRLWQVRRRALAPVKEWLADPMAWLDGGGPAIIGALAVGLAGWEVFGATRAFAQAAAGQGFANGAGNVFNQIMSSTSQQDLSFQWMQRLFPGTVEFWLLSAGNTGNAAATNADVLQPIFQILNSVLFALGAGMMCYHTVIGMIATAHSGKMLGERWHTTFAPLRIVWGVGNLAPVKGYCMAQILVINLILAGYGLANLEYQAYLSAVLGSGSNTAGQQGQNSVGPTMVAPPIDASQTLLPQLIKSETCVAVLQAIQANNPSGWFSRHFGFWNSTAAISIPEVNGVDINGARIWNYGPICGTYKMATTVSQSSSWYDYAHIVGPSAAEQQAGSDFDKVAASAFGTLIETVRGSALPQFFADTTTTVKATPSSSNQPQANDAQTSLAPLMDAMATYNMALASAAANFADNSDRAARDQFKATAAAQGWAGAGSINFTLARLSSQTSERVSNAVPNSTGVHVNTLSEDPESADRRSLEAALARVDKVIQDRSDADYITRAQAQVRESDASENPLAMLGKSLGDRIAVGLTNQVKLNELNPMGSFMFEGQVSLAAGEAMLTSYLGMEFISNSGYEATKNGITGLTSAIPAGLKAVIGSIAPFVDTIIGSLLIFGAINAYVLPMAPYLLWLFAVLACASFAFEAVVSASLAAFQHIRMDGAELINQEQKTIYGLTFNAFLRPSLLLLGLIASNALLAVMAGYVNRTFASAMLSSQGSGIIGIIGIVTMLAISMYVHYQIAIRCLRLITEVPRMVSSLLGVQDGERGEHDNHTNVFAAVSRGAQNMGNTVAGRVVAAGKAPKGGGDDAGGAGGSSSSAPSIVRSTPGQSDVLK